MIIWNLTQEYKEFSDFIRQQEKEHLSYLLQSNDPDRFVRANEYARDKPYLQIILRKGVTNKQIKVPPEGYLLFTLGLHDIEFIYAPSELHSCQLAITKYIEQEIARGKCPVVGVMTQSTFPRACSIFQIATRHKVYIIDFVNIQHPAVLFAVKNLLLWLFQNTEVVKVGFRCELNLARLQALQIDVLKDGACVVDCKQIAESKLLSSSFSELLKGLFGQTLAVFEEYSNWDKRPILYIKQLIYAAQHAHCLIGLYDKLMS